MFIGHFALGFGAKEWRRWFHSGRSFSPLNLPMSSGRSCWRRGSRWSRSNRQHGAHAVQLRELSLLAQPRGAGRLVDSVCRRLSIDSPIAHDGSRDCRRAGPQSLVLDLPMHRPDLPLTIGGSERFGFGLWNRPAIAIPLELLLFGGGIALYLRATRARTKAGTVGLWLLVVFLVAMYFAALFGPPPPSPTAVMWGGHFMWLLIAWAIGLIGNGLVVPRVPECQRCQRVGASAHCR